MVTFTTRFAYLRSLGWNHVCDNYYPTGKHPNAIYITMWRKDGLLLLDGWHDEMESRRPMKHMGTLYHYDLDDKKVPVNGALHFLGMINCTPNSFDRNRGMYKYDMFVL